MDLYRCPTGGVEMGKTGVGKGGSDGRMTLSMGENDAVDAADAESEQMPRPPVSGGVSLPKPAPPAAVPSSLPLSLASLFLLSLACCIISRAISAPDPTGSSPRGACIDNGVTS